MVFLSEIEGAISNDTPEEVEGSGVAAGEEKEEEKEEVVAPNKEVVDYRDIQVDDGSDVINENNEVSYAGAEKTMDLVWIKLRVEGDKGDLVGQRFGVFFGLVVSCIQLWLNTIQFNCFLISTSCLID